MNNRTKSVVGAVGVAVAGVAAGYAAGVLTAPASGQKTRKILARRLESKKDDLTHQARKSVKQAKATVSDAMSSAVSSARSRLRAV